MTPGSVRIVVVALALAILAPERAQAQCESSSLGMPPELFEETFTLDDHITTAPDHPPAAYAAVGSVFYYSRLERVGMVLPISSWAVLFSGDSRNDEMKLTSLGLVRGERLRLGAQVTAGREVRKHWDDDADTGRWMDRTIRTDLYLGWYPSTERTAWIRLEGRARDLDMKFLYNGTQYSSDYSGEFQFGVAARAQCAMAGLEWTVSLRRARLEAPLGTLRASRDQAPDLAIPPPEAPEQPVDFAGLRLTRQVLPQVKALASAWFSREGVFQVGNRVCVEGCRGFPYTTGRVETGRGAVGLELAAGRWSLRGGLGGGWTREEYQLTTFYYEDDVGGSWVGKVESSVDRITGWSSDLHLGLAYRASGYRIGGVLSRDVRGRSSLLRYTPLHPLSRLEVTVDL